MSKRPVAVVTGASSGIGAATAVQLSAAGFDVVLGARRLDRLQQVAGDSGGRAIKLDVASQASVDAFTEQLDRVDVLVNNAGGALGTETVQDAIVDDWQRMYDVNVLGTLRMTKALLPKLVASGDGRVVNIASIAARMPYVGGAGYNAAKHAVAAMTRVLRLEMLGQPVRIAEIDPGMVETEFSLVRFIGDQGKADAVYAGMTPLSADDVADAVTWIVTRPSHVNIDQIVMMPRDQVGPGLVHRR